VAFLQVIATYFCKLLSQLLTLQSDRRSARTAG